MAERPRTAPAGMAGQLPPQVLAGLEALARVGRALAGGTDLRDLAAQALAGICEALELEVASLYLAEERGPLALTRFVTAHAGPAVRRPHDRLAFDEEAWRLAVAGGRPLVLREPGSWLAEHPFDPPAGAWLVLPLASGGAPGGAVVASSSRPVELDPVAATVLSLLGDQLSVGLATARLRRAARLAELERERVRLLAEVHDGLAQDLALAVRELGALEDPAAPGASSERLRGAVLAAHRIVRSRLRDLAEPLPGGELHEELRALCDRVAGERGMQVRFSARGPAADLSPVAVGEVLRIAGEALANVARHAGRREAAVELAVDEAGLELVIADRGRGFPADAQPAPGHVGLTAMRERARGLHGSLDVASGPSGTRVALRVPCGA